MYIDPHAAFDLDLDFPQAYVYNNLDTDERQMKRCIRMMGILYIYTTVSFLHTVFGMPCFSCFPSCIEHACDYDTRFNYNIQ